MVDVARQIVNGRLLNEYQGKRITIIGSVSNMNPNSKAFDLRTVDDKVVKITATQPINGHISGLVEVHGESKGNNTVLCDNIVEFSPEMTENFDFSGHNDMCAIVNTVKDLWNLS